MSQRTCDLCGQELLENSGVRYEVRIEVQAAYEPLNLSEDDLSRDFQAEIAKVLQELENVSLAEAQNQVYRKFEFDLCPECQRGFVRDPLAISLRKTPK
jgi:hypothetical protein